MASDGKIVFEVTADGRKAVSEIKDISRTIENETKNWDKSAQEATDNMGNSFSSMLKKIAMGFSAAKIGQKLLDIGKEAISLASDLEEVQNVVDVTFGAEGANKIETWAKNAGTQFGLTETQAKRFTSTLGAMMKSSGMAGDEIVDMSTDLAGLAADMASFYNLDFDTAFQKIRSGISGETEPLKQLGINMSVANLNAYALKKGLEKTFEQMNQGEQTMLRYQYLMEATSDAQGDFARTSDGYANSVRLLETNLTQLQTNLGNVLVDVINPLLLGINSLFPESGGKRRSLLDDVTDIEIKKDEKIAEIEAIKKIADDLSSSLEDIATNKGAGEQLGKIAEGANKLDSSSKGNWEALLSSLTGIDGLQNLFGDGTTAEDKIAELAGALSGNGVSMTKAKAWETFLSALGDNADSVSKLTGKTAEETAEWLKQMSEAASELSPDDAGAWDTLMSSLLKGLNVGQTDGGKKFIELLAQNFLSMGSGSKEAVNGLAALGYTTDEIQEKQAAWLEICKELVKTIPGLSDIIDTNTGEVKGGVPAIKAYADEWERTQRYQAEIAALQEKQDFLNKKFDIPTLKGNVYAARAVMQARFDAAGYAAKSSSSGYGYEDAAEYVAQAMLERKRTFDAIMNSPDAHYLSEGAIADWFKGKSDREKEAFKDYVEALVMLRDAEQILPVINESIERSYEEIETESGKTREQIDAEAKAAKEAAENMTTLEKAAKNDATAMKTVTEAVENADEALKALADHVQSVHDKIVSSIDGVVKGFGKIETPMMQNANKIKELDEKIKKLDSSSKTYEKDLESLNNELGKAKGETISAQGMGYNLEQQAKYMDDYLANLRKAREIGISNEVLAQLSDGSVESYDYLAALAEASPAEVEKINQGFQQVADKKKELADELTAQQLTVDQTYQSLAEAAKQAVAELDLEKEAADNAGKTVEGVAKGISDKVPSLKEAVDQVLEQLSRLSALGIFTGTTSLFGNHNSWIPSLLSTVSSTFDNALSLLPGFDTGLSYVPADNFLARLHEGEAVLTAEENRIWQGIKSGSMTAVDYDSLGGVMRDNIKPGGNVYLDGKIVGSVISAQQGAAYRTLKRSGWQQ